MYKIYIIILSVLCSLPGFCQQSDDGWHIKALTGKDYNGIAMANGRIGLVSNKDLFSIKEIITNGIYDKVESGDVSRVIRTQVFANISLKIDGDQIDSNTVSNWQQDLQMKEAVLKTAMDFKNKAHIEYKILALRNLPYVGLMVVDIVPLMDCLLDVRNHFTFPPELQKCQTRYLPDGGVGAPVILATAQSKTGMHTISACAAFIFDTSNPEYIVMNGDRELLRAGFKIKLKKGKKYRFALAGSLCTTGNFKDPVLESQRMIIYALHQPIDNLLAAHKTLWSELWQGDIEIEGNLQDQRDVRLALFSLYSFSRAGTRLSIPPLGLSSWIGYNGHIFWDSELWMYPVLLLMNKEIAQTLMDYRYDRLNMAKQRADNYGYKGAMYPWESDNTGEEATPTWYLTGTFEHHITADVGIAMWNYYRVYQDKDWLEKIGWPVIKSVSDFWVSRCTKNKDGSYSIKNVVGADESVHNVDDNAFTNGSAAAVLQYATQAAGILHVSADPVWKEISTNIKFHYSKEGVLLEHSAYKGETINQADANLLIYPLGLISDKNKILKDTHYYERKMLENGPSMGSSILSVIYARLGDTAKAYDLYKKSYTWNKRPPFGVLSETKSSNNPYFVTAAGGMLQSVIFGMGGLEITGKGIVQKNPVLPETWKSLTIRGVGPEKVTFTVKRNL